MVTTFERLAKVLKGFVKPANWIERAFAELVSAIGSVLPSVSNSDRGKFLGVNSSNNNLGWKAIRQVPDVENADKGKYLHANGDTGALEWSEAGGSGGAEIAVFTVDDGTVTAPENFSANTSIVQISINGLLYPTTFSYDDKMCSAVQINNVANTLVYHYISYDDRHSSWLYETTEYTLTPATNS